MRRFLWLAVLLWLPSPLTGQIPAQAAKYRSRVVKEARLVWGLAAPNPCFFGQLQQESGYRTEAKSVTGALGLAQFEPGTAAWIAKVYPAQLGGGAPLDPDWAIRALVYYDHWLYQRLLMYQEAGNNRLAAALSAYNGGLGFAQRDAKIGNCSLWWGCAENINDGRTAANLKQNRDYPRRILLLYAPRYQAAGW